MSAAITGRNNHQTRVLVVGEDGTTHADRVYGNGVGAFGRMIDRTVAALTGWSRSEAKVEWDSAACSLTLTNRKTGEVRHYTTMEVD